MIKFQAKIAMSLGLEVHTLIVCSVEAGCVKLTFQIPKFVAKAIFPLSSEVRYSLKLLGVLKVACGDFDYDFGLTMMGASKVIYMYNICVSMLLLQAGGLASLTPCMLHLICIFHRVDLSTYLCTCYRVL